MGPEWSPRPVPDRATRERSNGPHAEREEYDRLKCAGPEFRNRQILPMRSDHAARAKPGVGALGSTRKAPIANVLKANPGTGPLGEHSAARRLLIDVASAGGRILASGKRMPYGMYISAAGAHVQSERLRVLSNNLANVDTPGFKRELAVFQARHAEAIERGEDVPGSKSINDIGGGVHFAETVTDFHSGTVRNTGVDTDLAIEGDGFFLVEKDGQQLLTKAGNFHFNSDGRLLTDQGYAVLSADGQPLSVDPRVAWSVSDSGAIEQAGNKWLPGGGQTAFTRGPRESRLQLVLAVGSCRARAAGRTPRAAGHARAVQRCTVAGNDGVDRDVPSLRVQRTHDPEPRPNDRFSRQSCLAARLRS